nr:hypothetical protein [Tanacetum cinerariifolium]
MVYILFGESDGGDGELGGGGCESMCSIKNLIMSENDILTFDGAIQLDTIQLKKSTNIVGSRKSGVIWSLHLLGICERYKVPFVYKDGFTIIWNYENLTELCHRESDEFMLDHE